MRQWAAAELAPHRHDYPCELLATNWANLFLLTLTTNNNIFVTDLFATNSARFYRVQKISSAVTLPPLSAFPRFQPNRSPAS